MGQTDLEAGACARLCGLVEACFVFMQKLK